MPSTKTSAQTKDTSESAIDSTHKPVMLSDVLEVLQSNLGQMDNRREPLRFVDATFGAGGYTAALLERFANKSTVLAIDRDVQAIELGKQRFAKQPVHFYNGKFSDTGSALNNIGWPSCDSIIFDYGISSTQLDDPARGFAFSHDGPLDMRMGNATTTAADLVNSLPEKPLADVIFHFGGEARSRSIARSVAAARRITRISTTSQLAQIVAQAVGRSGSHKIHPATRTFMALRIAVNDELVQIGRGLIEAKNCLAPGGLIISVTFHSLEDRIVKRFLRMTTSRKKPRKKIWQKPSHTNVGDNDADDANEQFIVMNSRPVSASHAETRSNPRARSAKLRWGIRTHAPATTDSNDFLSTIGALSLGDIVSNRNNHLV